jgi:CDP-diacylglycerol---serine O-phosphatidyltransferase
MSETQRKTHFSMLRSYTLADLFTLSNAACGTVAIFICLHYLAEDRTTSLWWAFGLFPAALIFDILDGYVARRGKRQSLIGADLDSLADVVSFGVAPAVIGFTLGLRGIWDVTILTFFVVCGISRLARFNVTAEDLAGETGKVAYFEGTPIPTSVLLVAVLAGLYHIGQVDTQMWAGQMKILGATLHPLSLMYALSGSAMISETLRIPKP